MSALSERYRASRELLAAARDGLQAAIVAGIASGDDRRRLATVDELLEPVRSTAVVDGKVVEVRRSRQFLSIDTAGQGHAVEVLGDLDEAANVAVLVPGMGNNLDTFRGQSDRGDLIRTEAGPGTAVVVWLDYDSPQGVVAAASKEAAIEGGPRLAAFLSELETLKPRAATTTLIGHSYGTDVVGQALLGGGRADRVVLTGSPGIEKYVDEAADFLPPATCLYVERAAGDYVAYTEWHGPDPATFPDAIRMATDSPVADDERVSVRWHNEYYRPNSEALRNIGRVVRGDITAITRTDTDRGAESRLAFGSWAPVLHTVASTASDIYNLFTPDHAPPQTTPSVDAAGSTNPADRPSGAVVETSASPATGAEAAPAASTAAGSGAAPGVGAGSGAGAGSGSDVAVDVGTGAGVGGDGGAGAGGSVGGGRGGPDGTARRRGRGMVDGRSARQVGGSGR